MARFRSRAEGVAGHPLPDTAALHAWSVADPGGFWALLWDFLDIRAEVPFERVVDNISDVAHSRWFDGARLSPVDTLLRRKDDQEALVYWTEASSRRSLTWGQLHDQVAALGHALRVRGVGRGDRVVAVCSNVPEAVVGLLASSSVGAIWSLCSPEYGAQGILDRFAQLAPVVLLGGSSHSYKGRRFDDVSLVREVASGLDSLRGLIWLGEPGGPLQQDESLYSELLAEHAGRPLERELLPFDHPGAVLFSSGTTGPPKCIVHSLSAIVLQLLKEHVLHYDLRPGDAFAYHTSTSWNMWYWLVAALAAEARVVLRDGSPFFPTDDALLRMAAAEDVAVFGVSPRYLAVIRERDVRVAAEPGLPALRTVLSTGSPLPVAGFRTVHSHIKAGVRVSSISGGTEIMTCFATGDPTGPVWEGELQCLALGMDVKVFDDHGRAVEGEKGELVCVQAFPSHPLGFWADPDGARYHAAYFERFTGVWHHGDFAETTPAGGMVIHGRSDATLKPGGIRVGTGELYPRVNRFPEIEDSLVSGLDTADGDVRIVLFVRLASGAQLDEALIQRLRARIRAETSPWHVPAHVLAVPDIPYTHTGKIAEIAVRRLINGGAVPDRRALRNPESLDHFPDLRPLLEAP